MRSAWPAGGVRRLRRCHRAITISSCPGPGTGRGRPVNDSASGSPYAVNTNAFGIGNSSSSGPRFGPPSGRPNDRYKVPEDRVIAHPVSDGTQAGTPSAGRNAERKAEWHDCPDHRHEGVRPGMVRVAPSARDDAGGPGRLPGHHRAALAQSRAAALPRRSRYLVSRPGRRDRRPGRDRGTDRRRRAAARNALLRGHSGTRRRQRGIRGRGHRGSQARWPRHCPATAPGPPAAGQLPRHARVRAGSGLGHRRPLRAVPSLATSRWGPRWRGCTTSTPRRA